MKTKIFSVMLSLTLIFSACNDKPIDFVNPDDNVSANARGATKTSTGKQYILLTTNFATITVDDEQKAITRFKLVNTVDPDDIEYAYCAHMNVYCYENSIYQAVSAEKYFTNGEDEQLMAVLSYAIHHYGWLETDHPTGYDQLLQSIVWSVIHGCEVTDISNDEADILEMYNDSFANFDKPVADPYETVVTMEGAGSAKTGAGFTDYGPFWVSENDLLENISFTLTLAEGDESAVFVIDGDETTQAKPGEPFYLRVPAGLTGDFKFTADAATTQDISFVSDYNFYVDIRDLNEEDEFDGVPSYQPVIQPLPDVETRQYSYACSGAFTVSEQPIETIVITGVNWNNGNGNGNGDGINQLTVNGVTLKNNKNYVTPDHFDVAVIQAPDKNEPAAIYTVLERTVTQNGTYQKVYDVKVALYENGFWKGYAGTITVDNPGGNNQNQAIVLERIF